MEYQMTSQGHGEGQSLDGISYDVIRAGRGLMEYHITSQEQGEG